MSIHADRHWRERLASRYINALDAGDLDAIAALWDEVDGDPAAEEFLRDVMIGVEDEESQEPDLAESAVLVADLARHTMPSAFPFPDAPKALTVADVARRLESEPEFRRLSPDDRRDHLRLADDPTPLPEALGWPQFERWSQGLGAKVSKPYWKAFHKVALMMTTSRNQQEGRLAAARRATPPQGGKGGAP